MIFSCKKIRNRSPTLSQVVHFHPSIQWLFLRTQKTPRGVIQLQTLPPNWRVPVLIQSAFLSTQPRMTRQGTLRLRQNRPRSRELRLRCYDLLSYTTPGVCSRKIFVEENRGKTGRLDFFAGKNIKLSQKKNKTHWEKTPLPKKNSSSWSKLTAFFWRGYSTFWGWMI